MRASLFDFDMEERLILGCQATGTVHEVATRRGEGAQGPQRGVIDASEMRRLKDSEGFFPEP